MKKKKSEGCNHSIEYSVTFVLFGSRLLSIRWKSLRIMKYKMDSRPQKVYKLGPMHAYKAEKDLRWYSEQIRQFCITGPNNMSHTVNKLQK